MSTQKKLISTTTIIIVIIIIIDMIFFCFKENVIFRFSAFLFLRLIVPGILYPKMHNLVNGKC